ncbi:hypothetical protein F0562_020502 [Nyssa sinensis]|uniref:GAGA-binding transcriptional activator n=1 Tax=Nyssa sinensis TaxID=561372 RepID=A0A5J5BWJ6_9ASTE|nr:hypothetical protein F0562_020502 [Nyssa sinensis]
MDDGGQRENGRHRMDYFKGAHTPWNMMPQYQVKEQNVFYMNKRIMHIITDRDAAVEERNRALSEKNAALDERDAAIQQRDAAISERDNAIRERDNAIAALQFQESTMNGTLGCGIQRGTKRMHHQTNQPANVAEAAYKTREVHITDAFPISAIASEAVKSRQAKRTKENKAVSSKTSKSPQKGKKVGEDLNRHVTTDGSKAEWDAQDLGLMNQVNFDESSMPIPVCSCTGLPRQCYKWGNWRLAVILLHHHPVSISTATDAKQAPCTNGWSEDERKCFYQIA